MDVAVAHDVFIHVRIVMGTVVGLGLTRLLMGTAGIIQHPQRAKLSLIHLLWVLSIMIELILFWWWEYELAELATWSFGTFAFLIIYSVTLFGLAALLFPDNLQDYEGYEDFFLKRRKWFFGLFGATFILDIIDTADQGPALSRDPRHRLPGAGAVRHRALHHRHLDDQPPLPSGDGHRAPDLPVLVGGVPVRGARLGQTRASCGDRRDRLRRRNLRHETLEPRIFHS